MSTDTKDFVQWFRSAAPYIHAHRGKTFVLHFEGQLINDDHFPHLIHDIALLNSLGIRMVIVNGARQQIEDLLLERKLKTQFVREFRVTSEDVLVSVKEAVGAAMIHIEALLSMGLPNSPMADAEIKVTSGNFVTARPVGVLDGIDLQYTGKVRRIDACSIANKLNNGEIVLVSSLGYSPTGEVFNLASIDVAVEIAIGLKADKSIFLVPGEGLKDKNGEFIHQLTQKEGERIVTEPDHDSSAHQQLVAGLKASNEGVERIHFVNQEIDGCLLLELFSRDGIGTLLSAEPFDHIRPATIDDIGGILELIKPLEVRGILVRRQREKMELEVEDYTVLVRDGAVIACAALHVDESESIAELACLVVSEEYQRLSKGEELYLVLEKNAVNKGVKKIFLLTTQTTHWFLERGFSETTMEDLSLAKQQLYNYKRNSKVLIKDIGS